MRGSVDRSRSGEDPAADGVQPGLLVVAADGQHQPAVEHGHAGDLLGGVEDRAPGGVHVAGLLDHHLVGRPRRTGPRRTRLRNSVAVSVGPLLASAAHRPPESSPSQPVTVVLATHPARAGARPQRVDDALEAGEPAGDVDVGVRAGVRRGRDQRLRARLVTAEGAVAVAGGQGEGQHDGDGEREESSRVRLAAHGR